MYERHTYKCRIHILEQEREAQEIQQLDTFNKRDLKQRSKMIPSIARSIDMSKIKKHNVVDRIKPLRIVSNSFLLLT